LDVNVKLNARLATGFVCTGGLSPSLGRPGMLDPGSGLSLVMSRWNTAADMNEIKEHDPGCPYVADDEGDFEFLADAGLCTCGVFPESDPRSYMYDVTLEKVQG